MVHCAQLQKVNLQIKKKFQAFNVIKAEKGNVNIATQTMLLGNNQQADAIYMLPAASLTGQ